MLYYLPWIINISSRPEVFFKIPGKAPVPESLFLYSSRTQTETFLKEETLSQVFSCELYTFCWLLQTVFECFYAGKKIESLKKSISTWRNTTKKNLWNSRI